MNNRGFTLAELCVAAGLLSFVIIAAFGIFGNSSKAFSSGSWRLTRQQEAQRFLLKFKENIEKASNAYQLSGNFNEMIASVPISVSKNYHNKIGAASNGGVLFTSSCTPVQAENKNLGIEKKDGIWKGYSLTYNNNVLSFSQTGDISFMHIHTPNRIRMGTDIIKGNLDQDFTASLHDVASIGVYICKATDSVDLKSNDILLTLKVGMTMPKSKGKTTVMEEITAKIHDKDIEHYSSVFIKDF